MSDGLKKLFQQNKQTTIVSKYLSQTSADSIEDGIESAGDLSESIRKRDAFIPAVDYGDPAQFVKFGSAEDYYNNEVYKILKNNDYIFINKIGVTNFFMYKKFANEISNLIKI